MGIRRSSDHSGFSGLFASITVIISVIAKIIIQAVVAFQRDLTEKPKRRDGELA